MVPAITSCANFGMAKLVVGTVVWVVIIAKLSKVVPKVPEGNFFFF
jgi:hypothetical protein